MSDVNRIVQKSVKNQLSMIKIGLKQCPPNTCLGGVGVVLFFV